MYPRLFEVAKTSNGNDHLQPPKQEINSTIHNSKQASPYCKFLV